MIVLFLVFFRNGWGIGVFLSHENVYTFFFSCREDKGKMVTLEGLELWYD